MALQRRDSHAVASALACPQRMREFEAMSSTVRRLHYTIAQYVSLEEESSIRHEYLDGEIYALAGGSPDHAALAAMVIRLLGTRLPRECRVLTRPKTTIGARKPVTTSNSRACARF